MEVFSEGGCGGVAGAVRTPAPVWRLSWPLIQRFVHGGMRESVNWGLRVPTRPVRVRRRLPYSLDIGALLWAVGTAVVVVAAVVVAAVVVVH